MCINLVIVSTFPKTIRYIFSYSCKSWMSGYMVVFWKVYIKNSFQVFSFHIVVLLLKEHHRCQVIPTTSSDLQNSTENTPPYEVQHQFHHNATLSQLRESDSLAYFSRKGLLTTTCYEGSDHRPHFKWAAFHDKLVLVY